MSRIIKRTFLAIGLVTALVCLWFAWWLYGDKTVGTVSVMVNPGETYATVVTRLSDQGVVGFPWLFSKIGVFIELDTKIIPGRYDFTGRVSNYAVMDKLWRGDIVIATVTIPEGYSLKQIGRVLSEKIGIDPRAFDSLARDARFLAGLGIGTDFAEGYLFPETYMFRWGLPAAEAFSSMVKVLGERLTGPLLARADSLGYSLKDLLTMASIIQREGKEPDEFPRIASVYYNRRKIGMRLQADPTVIYGMGGLNRKLLQRDYKFPSLYNTYLHKGLPPTPICSPGMAAIMAALYPEATNYLYFVANGTGRHTFNASYQEHLRDIREIRKRLQQQGG